MFEIDSGVEIPPKIVGRTKYPWLDMAVGDSFFVSRGDFKRIRWAATAHTSKYGTRFSVRRMDGGIRVWRVE